MEDAFDSLPFTIRVVQYFIFNALGTQSEKQTTDRHKVQIVSAITELVHTL